MNEPHGLWFAVGVSWVGSLATITVAQALGVVCALFSITASIYAIAVSRAKLRKLEDDE